MSCLILQISHTDISQDSRILKQIRALEALDGFECCGIGIKSAEEAVSGSNNIRSSVKSFDLIVKPNKRVRGIFRHLFAFFSLLELTLRFCYMGYKKKPDVVHCHDAICLIAAVLLKKFVGCCLVYDAHELESDRNGQSRLFGSITLWIERVCWSSVDLFITVSESIDCWYQSKLGPKKSIIVLNSPEVSKIVGGTDANRYSLKDKFDLADDRLVFIYAGLLSRGRGIEILLDLFSTEFLGADLVFLGHGELKHLVLENTKRSKNIHFLPPVEHSKVVQTLRSADYGFCFIEKVSLSDYYCLPNKLFEYAFAGVFAIASNFPEISKVLNRFCLGATVGTNREDLAAVIRRVITERPTVKALDLQELSWPRQCQILIAGYKQMLFATKP